MIEYNCTTFFDKPNDILDVSYSFLIDPQVPNTLSNPNKDFIKALVNNSLQYSISNPHDTQQILSWFNQQIELAPPIENSSIIINDLKISFSHVLIERQSHRLILLGILIQHKNSNF